MADRPSLAAEVFANATEQAPQVPFLGTLMLLNQVVIPRGVTVSELVANPFVPETTDYQYVVARALGAHRRADMPWMDIEPSTVAHAQEQVYSQLAMAVAALRTGDDSIRPDNVHPINRAHVGSADFFLKFSVRRHPLSRLVRGILLHLQSSDNAQRALHQYRQDAAQISVEGHQVEQTPENINARKDRLAARRVALMEELDPELRRGAAEHTERQGVEAFLRVLALPDSTPELLRKHGLIPAEE